VRERGGGNLGNGVHDVVDHHELGVPELVLEVDAERLHTLQKWKAD